MPRKKPPNPAPASAPAHEAPPNAGVNPAVADHATPEESLPFPIVAIGASAGGLEAFTELLKALPVDTGMAFVMVQHLSPTHESMLPEILGRATSMPVRQVENNVRVEPNHVYVIPPAKSMVLAHGLLQLAPRTQVAGVARPIDHFMRSLAEEHGHKAIGVVLSGTGTDGTLGLEEIKAGSGITFAQDATAEQSHMPRSAIAAGAVDFVLPADEIGRELGRIASHPYVAPAAPDVPAHDAAFGRVLEILGASTDVDFVHYKKTTLHRRVARRMMLQKIEDLPEYADMLQRTPDEVEALYQDVLINVTSFFRDPEAYEGLKSEVFPKLTEERSRNESVRVWALGCSTGEEAYSIAMAYTEYLEQSGRRIPMQVFATDLNGMGIERARAGIYSKGIVQDVSPERLRRFFVEVDGSYRIAKPIREMCVFARQNVLSDPPFSRLDLVACRNMLIYLEPVLQQKLIPLLHYSLRNDGFLWLGNSETIGTYRDLFDLTDVRHKIYTKKPGGRRSAFSIPLHSNRVVAGPTLREPREHRPAFDLQGEADRVLLAQYAPPGIVVDAQHEIIQFRGDTAPFLSPSPGKASLNLLKMLNPGLLAPVRGALHRARKERGKVQLDGLRVKSGEGWRDINVVVLPLETGEADAGKYLVLFEEPATGLQARAKKKVAEADARIDRGEVSRDELASEREVARLKQELEATSSYLQSVVEQQEAANEELQSANEEVQSANEELQSVNEELETSKEEIQSSNEELATVNDELGNRNTLLGETNDDLLNFMGSVQMAIVMLGSDLRIRRYTPMAEKLMNLVPGDLGRPIAEVRTNLSITDLHEMAAEVIDTISAREREVRDRSGRWFSLRVRPYRTHENKIDGAVLVLVDIDDLKGTQHALLESESRFQILADSAPVPIWLADAEGARHVNRAFQEFVGATEHDIRTAEPARYVHPEDRAGYLESYQAALRNGTTFEARFRKRRADGAYRWVKSVGVPTFLRDGQLLGLVGVTIDITEMKDAEAAFAELDRGKNEFLAMLAHELRNPLAGVRSASHLLSEAPTGAIADKAREIIDRQTGIMMRMVEDLLDVTRLTHGKIELRLAPVELRGVVERTIASLESEIATRKQTVSISMADVPLWVHGDSMRLEQIIANLLSNASKFTRHGGQIWVGLRHDVPKKGGGAGRAVFSVRDNGVGIDPAIIDRIFELFVQDRSTERSRSGVGLGLTLAKRLVELHGGTIQAHSAGNALGSEFVMGLPLLPAARVPQVPAGQKRPALADVSPRRILVVDDNVDAAESLRLLLAAKGHHVRATNAGARALPEAKAFAPEVILLDIGLPDLDGYRVARELRADAAGRDAHIVAVSGFGQPDDIRKSRDAGFDEHLTKPVDVDALLHSIARGRQPRT